MAASETPGAWCAGRRLVAIDGTCLDAADTPANVEVFGRPGVNKGEQAAFPLVRLVGLAECGTHAIFDAEIGPYTVSEHELARELVQRAEPGMLVLADRAFYGYDMSALAVSSGADLLWRVKSNVKPTHLETLADRRQARNDEFQHVYRQHRPMVERTISWMMRQGHGKVRYRGIERNRIGFSHRAAAVNLQRLINLGLAHNGTTWTIA